MSGPALVTLRCGGCNAFLAESVKPGDRVFLCASCPTATEATATGLRAYPVIFGDTGRDGAYALWWRFECNVRIMKFSATKPAQTPFGTVDEGRTLAAVLSIPTDATTIGACYRAALAETTPPLTAPRRGKTTARGHLDRDAALLVAKQVFLTHVARAEGKVHFIDVELELTRAQIFAEPRRR